MNFLTDENRKKIVNCLFYVALTIELVLMIVEKSEMVFPYESYVFRVTFVLTFLAVLIMKHGWKEWIGIIIVLAVSFYCYRLSGKNDLLRLAVFLMASRDIDLEKAMKYSFYTTLAGFVLIFVLAVLGLYGDVAQIGDFGRGIPDEKRYVFGFGHPNTMFGCGYALFLMWLWLYGKSSKWWQYGLVAVLLAALVVVTRSRTGLLICGLTLVIGAGAKLAPKLAKEPTIYLEGTILSTVSCVILSVLAAYQASVVFIEDMAEPEFWLFEAKINFRISNLYYSTDDRGGVLYRWKLFAGRSSESYFDMGWDRLFYWYGIIPTLAIIICVLIVAYMSYKKQNLWTLILIISLSMYTLMEATFITPYFGRDFFLLIGGVYLGDFFKDIFADKALIKKEK